MPHFGAEQMSMGPHHKWGRKLVGDDEEICHSSHSNQNACDADARCSWCKSAAVASSCHSIENARSLPSAVFACDKLTVQEELMMPVEKKIIEKVDDQEDTCNKNYKSQSACDAVNECSWCKSAAVASSCHSVENAKSLPPAVFACDKVSFMDVVMKTKDEIVGDFKKGMKKAKHMKKEKFDELKKKAKHERDELKKEFATGIEEGKKEFRKIHNRFAGFWNTIKDDFSCTYKDKDSCNLDDGCAWCVAAAVPSACRTLEQAHGLPPAVFTCDKVSESVDEEVDESPESVFKGFMDKMKPQTDRRQNPYHMFFDDDEHCEGLSENQCHSDKTCSWCTAGAVRPACHSVEAAKTLPPSVFACDNLNASPKVQAYRPSGPYAIPEPEEEPEEEAPKPLIMPRFSWGHEKRGQHQGPPPHKRHPFCPVKVLLIIVFIAHFYFLKKYQHALEDFIQAGGKPKPMCKWMKNKECRKNKRCEQEQVQNTQRQSPVFEYSIVDHDKEFPEVVAPEPQVQTYRVDQESHQMV